MRVYFLFFCLCFLTSCLNVKELEYKGFNDISFSKKNGCNPFCIYLDVYNPNNFKINLDVDKNFSMLQSKKNILLEIEKKLKVLDQTLEVFIEEILDKNKLRLKNSPQKLS